MADQNVREQNLDLEGNIRVRHQGLQTIFAGPAPDPFHFQTTLNPKATFFEGKTRKSGKTILYPHLAITSFTVSNASFGDDSHFVRLRFIDHQRQQEQDVTTPLAPVGTLHLAYPHPIVLPLTPSDHWSVEVEDMKPTGALVPVTIVGYGFTTAVEPMIIPGGGTTKPRRRKPGT